MPFVATWMELGILILSAGSQKEKDIYHMTYTWDLKYGTDEPNYRTEADSPTCTADLWLPRGRGRDWDLLGVWSS